MALKISAERHIVLTRNVVSRWLEANSHPEYSFMLYFMGKEVRGIPGILRSFRDAKIKMGDVDPIPDLGVAEDFDSVRVWSSNREGLKSLAEWFESHGYETSGVW